MKKVTNIALALIALCATCVFCDEASSVEMRRHRLYFGPEIANVSVDTHIKDVQVKGSKNFAGLRLGYEFVKPWAFYAGIDYLSMMTSRYYQALQQGERIHSSKQDTIYGNLDFRFGYTLFPSQCLISPYLGLGLYALGSAPSNRGFHQEWAYWSAGIRSQFALNQIFSLGLNLKVFQSFFFFRQFENHDVDVFRHSCPWGIDIGMPMIWKCNLAGNWTFQLEPYWTKLDFTQKQNVLGSKFLIGVHF